jgi:aldehyde dehydrogenase (NAD(P)+)
VLLTASDWPQRPEFLRRLDAALAALPARPPFHPSARAHWQVAAGEPAPAAALPPVRRALGPGRDPSLLAREHFAPVLLDWSLAGGSVEAFLDRASGGVRDHVFGALSCYLFAPPRLRAEHGQAIDVALARLPHGTVAINTWTGLGYGLGSTPWGAPPPAPDAAGRGQVHNAVGLTGVRQVVIEAPFRQLPTPPWLAPDRRAAATLRALAQFYLAPSPLRLLRTALAAVLPRR